jgi:signal transduction histidine kinase/tetratricopeptide (TPR) repeat protein
MSSIDITDELLDLVTQKINNRDKDTFKFVTNIYNNHNPNINILQLIKFQILHATVYAHINYNYKKAIVLLNNLLKYKELEKEHIIKGKILYKLGTYHNQFGNYTESYIAFTKAIEIFRIALKKNTEAEILIAHCIINLGILSRISNFNEFNKKDIQLAKKIYEKAKDIKGIENCYDLYASYYQHINNNKKATIYLLKSLAISEKTNNLKAMAISYNNIASSYAIVGDFIKAFDYHTKSYSIRKKLNDKYLLAVHYMHLAKSYQLYKDYHKSILNNNKAKKFFEQFGYKAELATIYKSLSDSCIKLNQHKKANIYLLKYIELQNIISVFDKETALINNKLQFSLQTKEKEAKALKIKNKEFEQLNNELNQFAYIASHDLKEPIRTLNSYIHLLKRSFNNLNSEQEEYFNYIKLYSERIFSLINDLNNFTTIQAPIEKTKIDLNEIVDICIENLGLLIKERNVKIIIKKLPIIHAPSSHIQDLFLNLLQNAIKYNKSSIPTININYKSTEKSHVISIKDNGIGIDKKFYNDVFFVFKRLHTKNEYDGTGIGLAICKKIVEQNKGQIWVESELGKGSTFYISFPK